MKLKTTLTVLSLVMIPAAIASLVIDKPNSMFVCLVMMAISAIIAEAIG